MILILVSWVQQRNGDQSGVGAASGSSPAFRRSRHNRPGISAAIRSAFCITSAAVRGPGITAATTGWAAQNCSAAARISTLCRSHTARTAFVLATISLRAGS